MVCPSTVASGALTPVAEVGAGAFAGAFGGVSARFIETDTDGDDCAKADGTNTDAKTRPNSSWDAFMAGILRGSAGSETIPSAAAESIKIHPVWLFPLACELATE